MTFNIGDMVVIDGVNGVDSYDVFYDVSHDFEDGDIGEILAISHYSSEGYLWEIRFEDRDMDWHFHANDIHLLKPYKPVPIRDRVINKIKYIQDKRKGLGYEF